MASVGSQWLKKTVLTRNLPTKQKEDVKALLLLPRSEAGTNIYLRIKRELVRIYSPKPSDSYKKALTRTMTGLPSQLGYQIIDDICKKTNKLDGCCCEGAAFALWSLQIPVNVRAHVSNTPFNRHTYQQVFEAADQVHLSSRQVSVAALMRAEGGAEALDETLPAFTTQNQPQVAAIQNKQNGGGKGGGQGKNKKNNKNGGQKGSKPTRRGPKHSSNPPDSVCDRHYVHGDQSWYCVAPTTCP